MKTSSIAVETSRSTTQSDSIVKQTNKRSSYLSYTTMNNKHIFNDTKACLLQIVLMTVFLFGTGIPLERTQPFQNGVAVMMVYHNKGVHEKPFVHDLPKWQQRCHATNALF